MSDPVEQLMLANLLGVFNERDAGARQPAIGSTYAEAVRWTDAEGVTVGRDGLEAKCIALQQTLGGLTFEAVGPVHRLPGFGYLAWRLVDAGGASPMSGFDAAVVRDGQITDLWTVLTPPS